MRTLATLALTVLLALSAAACSSDDGSTGGNSATRAGHVASLTGDGAKGATTYDAKCAGCHGADGKGVSGPSLVASPKADLTTQAMVTAVLDGKGTMPSFSTLTDEEIANTIAYVKGELRNK